MTDKEYEKAARVLDFNREEARNAAWLKFSKSRDKIDATYQTDMAKLEDLRWAGEKRFVRNESMPLPPF